MVEAAYISGRDPGDENEQEDRVPPSFWHPGFPGVPRGTSQPHLNIPPFTVPVLYQCNRCKDNGCAQCQGD